ncbi:MAG: hypothetical protein K6L80_07890 [Agarilytica sp.]
MRNLKSFPVDRYVLFYMLTETKYIMVRVLPADRDILHIF